MYSYTTALRCVRIWICASVLPAVNAVLPIVIQYLIFKGVTQLHVLCSGTVTPVNTATCGPVNWPLWRGGCIIEVDCNVLVLC